MLTATDTTRSLDRAAKGDAHAWECFHGAVAAQFVETPLFIANSK